MVRFLVTTIARNNVNYMTLLKLSTCARFSLTTLENIASNVVKTAKMADRIVLVRVVGEKKTNGKRR